MCGAFVRRCWLPSDNAGRNASGNTSGNARACWWSLQTAPVVTPGRAARSRALAVSLLLCLCAGMASVNAALCPGLINAPERHLSDAGALHGASTHAATMPAALARFTVPRVPLLHAPSWTPPRRATPRALARSAVKRGDRGDLPGFVGIRLRLPEYAQCPSARRLGTVGAMSHATQNARERTRRAPTLPRSNARARTCPEVANSAQECPTRTVALTVQGGTRDNAARAVRHDGCPRYAGPSRLTAWRHTSWLRVRSVGHSAAGSVSPMQGHHEAPNYFPRAGDGERREPRASVRKRHGTLRSAALPQIQRAAPVREGSQP
jgi:hypothetical protein